jgi:hypothetical protein
VRVFIEFLREHFGGGLPELGIRRQMLEAPEA